MDMAFDLNSFRKQLETGDQDAALEALQSYNTQMDQCFTFSREEERDRQHLAELVIGFLQKELQPSCQLTCLETLRILSRDERCQDPFTNHSAMSTLAGCAGITAAATPDRRQSVECPVEDDGAEGGEKEEASSEVVNEASLSGSLDQDMRVEALKCICNILLHSGTGQVIAADLQLIKGATEKLKPCHDVCRNDKERFFNLRLIFLLTALRVDVRTQLAQELHGVTLLGNHLEATLGLCWTDTLDASRTGLEGIPPEQLPPLTRQKTEIAMEILKILFNITFDTTGRKVDEEEAAQYRHLGAVLRHCLMSRADGEELTDEFHSHTVNLLGNLPIPCLDVLLLPKVHQGSTEYMGINMDAVDMLLNFMERRLDKGQKLKETLLPSLKVLTESSRIHKETRKFLRTKVLPPLRDVRSRPEVGNTLRNKLVRLMTHVDTDVKDCAAEFIFVLCKESVPRFIKYTGYGNGAGLLAAKGLLGTGKETEKYSDDEDSETEEYRESKARINPITGVLEEEQPNPMEGMTEEQKEYEAIKLVNMFDRLSRANVIQPMQLGRDGKMTEMTLEGLNKQTHNPVLTEEPTTPDNADEEN